MSYQHQDNHLYQVVQKFLQQLEEDLERPSVVVDNAPADVHYIDFIPADQIDLCPPVQVRVVPRVLKDGEIKLYIYPILPEQSGKSAIVLTWAVLYTVSEALIKELDQYRVLLYEAGSAHTKLVCEMPAAKGVSWVKVVDDPHTDQALYQLKLAFVVPSTTFNRTLCDAVLHNRKTGVTVPLGPSSIVSNTGQRRQTFPLIRSHCASDEQLRLVTNFETHKSKDRHYLNNKGARQGHRARPGASPGHFRQDELAKAVHMPIYTPGGLIE
jgi:hypothetical protein